MVLVSSFESSSNILPWKKAGALIQVVPMTSEGDIDYDFAMKKLEEL